MVRGKPPFEEGYRVYCVSIQHTQDYYGFYGDAEGILGKRGTILAVEGDAWSNHWKIKVSFKGGREVYMHEKDLSKKNTYVDPMGDLPEYVKEIKKLPLSVSNSYRCHWLMYSPIKGADWMDLGLDDRYIFLHNKLDMRDSVCSTCQKRYTYDCQGADICDEYAEWKKSKATKIVGCANRNTACWASVMNQWRIVYETRGKHPKRLIAKVRDCDLSMSVAEVISFMKYMKRGKCLPSYFKLPELGDGENRDLYFEIKLHNINSVRLFWYLCVIRNIAEKPGLPLLTNFLVEKGGVEPLVAYTLAHIMCPNFSGGHSSISDACDYRRGKLDGSVPNPKVKETTEFIVKLYKFLTTETQKRVTHEPNFANWRCAAHTQNVVTGWKSNVKTLEELLRFNPKTRTIKEK